jgi:hypothetical protein
VVPPETVLSGCEERLKSCGVRVKWVMLPVASRDHTNVSPSGAIYNYDTPVANKNRTFLIPNS